MEMKEIFEAGINPPQDLVARFKLTTERCFYANDSLYSLLALRV
jgi:hypothetical protein